MPGLTVVLALLSIVVPWLSHLRVFRLSQADLNSLPFVLGITLYVLTPQQEVLARGSLQGPLEQVFTGRYRHWYANVMANLMFSVFHRHLGFTFALMVLVPGLFWGWLYSRQKTLVGVSISHAIIGVYGLAVLNTKAFVEVMIHWAAAEWLRARGCESTPGCGDGMAPECSPQRRHRVPSSNAPS